MRFGYIGESAMVFSFDPGSDCMYSSRLTGVLDETGTSAEVANSDELELTGGSDDATSEDETKFFTFVATVVDVTNDIEMVFMLKPSSKLLLRAWRVVKCSFAPLLVAAL